MQEMQFSGFIGVEIYVTGQNPADGLTLAPARLNPMNVVSYHKAFITFKGEVKEMTIVACGHDFYVDLPFEKFDRLFSRAERGIFVKDYNYIYRNPHP